MADDLKDHLCNAVASSKSESTPFCHFYVEKLFPEDIYNNMLSLLPNKDMFYIMDRARRGIFRQDGSPTRTVFDLDKEHLCDLPQGMDLWMQVATAIKSKCYWDIVIEKLRYGLMERFGDHKVDGICYCALYRDEHGYNISPHPDVRRKIITMQFYLPKDDSQIELGTHLYEKRNNKFHKVKTHKFLPNTGHAFAVGSQSYHGREMVPDSAGVRYSITIFLKTR